MTFPNSFFVDVEFVPYVETVSDQGAMTPDYSTTGTTVKASVQTQRQERMSDAGVLLSQTTADIYLQNDPSSLNSGNGVRNEDVFKLDGAVYKALAPAADVCPAGPIRLWWVRCVRVV